MHDQPRKYWLLLLVLILLISVIYLFVIDFKNSHRNFTLAMLDVGQGDAIFIESPSGVQVMFDGGPPRSVLGPLSRVASPFDRYIDALVITNPDADHIGGFLDILEKYKVGAVFYPGTLSDSKVYQNLQAEIKKKNIKFIMLRRGMNLDLGAGVDIDVLFPDRDVSTWTTNDGSVVARMTYGMHTFMLTGDATKKTEEIILKENDAPLLKSEFLKVGHHGSRSSTSELFVKTLAPTYALISDGKDNKYGHPHKETLGVLEKFKVHILRTDLLGSIVVRCDIIKPCEIN